MRKEEKRCVYKTSWTIDASLMICSIHSKVFQGEIVKYSKYVSEVVVYCTVFSKKTSQEKKIISKKTSQETKFFYAQEWSKDKLFGSHNGWTLVVTSRENNSKENGDWGQPSQGGLHTW